MINSPQIGLLGQLLDSKLTASDIQECTTCELAELIKKKILHRIITLDLDPDIAVEIDGEEWDKPGIVEALRQLYDWADGLCGGEDKSVAVFSNNSSCRRSSCQ